MKLGWACGCVRPVCSAIALLLPMLVGVELRATLVISEVMATRGSPIVDLDRDRSDWIELFNSGTAPVELAGWGLSDREGFDDVWRFSSGFLSAGEFLVVFASGKDCRDAGDQYHTDFKLRRSGEPLFLVDPDGVVRSQFAPSFPPQVDGFSYGHSMNLAVGAVIDEGTDVRYRVPLAEDHATAWRQLDFEDEDWLPGKGSLGYDRSTPPLLLPYVDTDIGEEIAGGGATVYARYRFRTDHESQILRIRLRFDDGIALYLNGKEVRRVNAPARLNYRSRSSRVRGTEEVLREETILLRVADGLQVGENLLACQMLNTRSSDRDLLLSLRADLIRLEDHRLGERLFFSRPSPGVPNEGGIQAVLEAPMVSLVSGMYRAGTEILLTSKNPEVAIRYTLDGSIPSAQSPLYEGPIAIANSTTLRARCFTNTSSEGAVGSWHYLVADEAVRRFSSNLPVVVVDTFGQRIAGARATRGLLQIYDVGEGGRARLDQEPLMSEEATFKERGSSTAGRPKKAYNVELQDLFGDDVDREVLGMPAESDWILYAPYNFDRALIRNPFMYELSNQIGMYAVRTRFCEVYVNTRAGRQLTNTSYVGVYVLMEKIKRGTDRVPVEKLLWKDTRRPEISGGYILKIDRLDPGDTGFSAGSQGLAHVYPKEDDRTSAQLNFLRNHLNAFDGAIRGSNAADPVRGYPRYIDVESFIDFHMFNEFSKNPDGLRLSTYMHMPRSGKLTMGPIWDFDRTMGPDDDGRAANPRGRSSVYNFGWWGRLFRDPDFKQLYADRWQLWRDRVMTQENLFSIINSMAEEVEEAQERNFNRWRLVTETAGWRRELTQLKSWVGRRLEWFDSEFVPRPVPSLEPGVIEAGVELSLGVEDGEIYYTTDGSDPRFTGGFVSQSASLFDPDESLVLDESVIVIARTRVDVRRGKEWSPPFRGVYLVGESAKIVISEIMYHPAEPPADSVWSESDYEFIEIRSASDRSLTLLGARLSAGVSFEFPRLDLAPGQRAVVVRNREAFAERYPEASESVMGEFRGSLSNRGETIRIEDAYGRSLAEVTYEDRGDWDPLADGEGHSLVLLRGADNLDAAANWRASSVLGGSPGASDDVSVVIEGWQIDGGRLQLSITGLTRGTAVLERARGDTPLVWETVAVLQSAQGGAPVRYSELLQDGAWLYRVRTP